MMDATFHGQSAPRWRGFYVVQAPRWHHSVTRRRAAAAIIRALRALHTGPRPKTSVRPSTAMANRRAVSPAAVKQSALPASPWRANRERVREREVKREAVIRAAAHA